MRPTPERNCSSAAGYSSRDLRSLIMISGRSTPSANSSAARSKLCSTAIDPTIRISWQAVTAPAPPWGLTDASLRSVGGLLRRLHDAVAGFDPSPYTWTTSAPPPFAGTSVTHNDPNLDNVVFRDGRAVALVDFDLAAPGDPVWDVAGTARLWAPLRDPVDASDGRRHRELARLRILADAYGLDDDGRSRLAAATGAHHAWMCELVGDGARNGVPGFAEYWTPDAQARAARTDRWLERQSGAITAALI